MTVLCGTLTDVGLPPLLRFLLSLGKSGHLRIARGRWQAELAFDRGQIVAAAIGEESGRGVLETIILALSDGEFTFAEGPPPVVASPDAQSRALQARAQALAAADATPSPMASLLTVTPQLIEPILEAGVLRLDRRTLGILLKVDGQRTVEEIAGQFGLVRTTRALLRLRALRLACFATPSEPMEQLAGIAHRAAGGRRAAGPRAGGRRRGRHSHAAPAASGGTPIERASPATGRASRRRPAATGASRRTARSVAAGGGRAGPASRSRRQTSMSEEQGR